MPPTVDRNVTAEVRAERQPTHRPSVDRGSTKLKNMSTDVGRVSVDLSAETRPKCRPMVSVDTPPTDALNTHDPKKEIIFKAFALRYPIANGS